MNNKSYKQITVRINEELLDKLTVISKSECRTLSSQVRIFIRDYIREFEAEHGEIISDEKN